MHSIVSCTPDMLVGHASVNISSIVFPCCIRGCGYGSKCAKIQMKINIFWSGNELRNYLSLPADGNQTHDFQPSWVIFYTAIYAKLVHSSSEQYLCKLRGYATSCGHFEFQSKVRYVFDWVQQSVNFWYSTFQSFSEIILFYSAEMYVVDLLLVRKKAYRQTTIPALTIPSEQKSVLNA